MTDNLEDKVELWNPKDLIPYERNNKNHTEGSISKLAESMKRGQITPVIVDRAGVIVAGHGRTLAAIKLGWSKIKVIQLDIDEEEAKAKRLADNLTSNQDYDFANIRLDISDLAAGLDLDAIGDLGAGLGLDMKEIGTIIPELTDRLDANQDAIPENIVAAVEEFGNQNELHMHDMNERPIPIAKILGFGTIFPTQARKIGRFIAHIEDDTGLKGADAMTAWIEKMDIA
jgi:hypothetical protein